MVEGYVPSDPGWRPVVRKVLPRLIVPIGLGRRSVDDDDEPPVILTRAIFLSFAVALVLFLYVLTFIHPWSSDEAVPGSVHLLLVAGLIAVVFVPWAKRRAVRSCGSRTELATQYVASFFLGIAFAETAALLAFVATFLAGVMWPYAVGMLVSFVGFGLIAPTATRIRRLDESLSAKGCAGSLRAALYLPTDAGNVDQPDS